MVAEKTPILDGLHHSVTMGVMGQPRIRGCLSSWNQAVEAGPQSLSGDSIGSLHTNKTVHTSSNSTIRDEAGDKGVEARRASGQEPGGAKTKLMVSDRGLRLFFRGYDPAGRVRDR